MIGLAQGGCDRVSSVGVGLVSGSVWTRCERVVPLRGSPLGNVEQQRERGMLLIGHCWWSP